MVIEKMRDILSQKQNRDAISRGKLNKTKKACAGLKGDINEDILVV